MKTRFEGDARKANLINVLLEQRVIAHNKDAATAIAAEGEVVSFASGAAIITQGHADSIAYFILSGQAKVLINDREVGTRGPRDLVGEMVMIDPSAPRSATVVAHNEVTALKVQCATLERTANEHPLLWRQIASILCERLRERSRHHRPRNPKPVLFIGSSVEGLEIARAVEAHFEHDDFSVRVWNNGIFGPGGVTLDDLRAQVNQADFALFVFTPDDVVGSRGHEQEAPRDNVIFELGLFMERLGRKRVFMLSKHGADLKIPTDLLGIAALTYNAKEHSNLAQQLGPATTKLRDLMHGLGAW